MPTRCSVLRTIPGKRAWQAFLAYLHLIDQEAEAWRVYRNLFMLHSSYVIEPQLRSTFLFKIWALRSPWHFCWVLLFEATEIPTKKGINKKDLAQGTAKGKCDFRRHPVQALWPLAQTSLACWLRSRAGFTEATLHPHSHPVRVKVKPDHVWNKHPEAGALIGPIPGWVLRLRVELTLRAHH